MGKYVYRKLLETDAMVQWAKEQGLTHMLDPKDLHVTIIYSNVDFEKAPDPHTIKLKGGKRVISKFPSKYGNKKALVLEFSCPLIDQNHAAYLAAGATSDFPTFLLHVTLTYNGSDIDVADIEPYKGSLYFSKEFQEPLTDEPWEYKEIDLSEIETLNVVERKMVMKLAGNLIDLTVICEKDKTLLEQKLQAQADFDEILSAYIAYELTKK